MKYFVINLDKRKDRWENMKKQLINQNMLEKTTRFSAIQRTWTTIPFEKLSDKLSEEEVKELEEAGRTEFASWGDDEKWFVVVDKMNIYYHTEIKNNEKGYMIIKRMAVEDHPFAGRTIHIP